MNITLTGTKVKQDTRTLAFEKNNLVDVINVTVDTDEAWSYKLDIKYPEKCCTGEQLYNIIDLSRTGDVATVELTAAMLPFSGKYTAQLRGINGDKVWHSDVFEMWVKYSIEPGSAYDPVPSEFYQIEANINSINEHPPMPGTNGYWMIWNVKTQQYDESAIPLPDMLPKIDESTKGQYLTNDGTEASWGELPRLEGNNYGWGLAKRQQTNNYSGDVSSKYIKVLELNESGELYIKKENMVVASITTANDMDSILESEWGTSIIIKYSGSYIDNALGFSDADYPLWLSMYDVSYSPTRLHYIYKTATNFSGSFDVNPYTKLFESSQRYYSDGPLYVDIEYDGNGGFDTDVEFNDIQAAYYEGRTIIAMFENLSYSLIDFQDSSHALFCNQVSLVSNYSRIFYILSDNSVVSYQDSLIDSNAVHFNVKQDLTPTRQAQARANIGLTPVAKTDAMTQSVGLDEETGELWAVPAAGDNIVLTSSTAGSTKKFRIAVDDSGTLSAVEITN